jgi:Zn-dependent peptidase ImmA (M78 family)
VRFRDSRSSLAINLEEIQANRFAACLLMPEQLVEEQANRILGRAQETSREDLIAQLAQGFQVSQQAMEYRLNSLGALGPL